MKKPKQPTIEQLTKERDKLLVSRSDPKRLEFLNKKIDYFNWGIK